MNIKTNLWHFLLKHDSLYAFYNMTPIKKRSSKKYVKEYLRKCEYAKINLKTDLIDMEGVLLKIDPNSNHDLGFYYDWLNGQIYDEPLTKMLEIVLRHSENFAHVDTNNGFYSILAAKRVSGMVYAFEPSKEAYRRLIQNISINNLSNVKAYNIALSDKKGRSYLYHSAVEDGSNSLARVREALGTEEVEVDTPDNILDGVRLDVIKIDVEGYEEEAVKGALDHLADAMVFFERNRELLALRKRNPNGLFKLFSSMGFELYWIYSAGKLKRVRSYKDVLTSTTNILATARIPDYLENYEVNI